MKKSFLRITAVAILAGALFSCSQASGGGSSQSSTPKNDWAHTPSVSLLTSHSRFFGLAADSAGNVYAAGSMTGPETFSFGNSVTAQITSIPEDRNNALLVKYADNGAAQWARGPVIAPARSRFYAAATDSANNVYAAGYAAGTTAFDFGTGTVTGGSTGYNCLLAKYNSAGQAQWTRITGNSPGDARFFSVAVSSDGSSIYAAGYIGASAYNFGGTATVAAGTGTRAVVVKYDTSGDGIWAQVINADSAFLGIACDSSGNVYAAGSIGRVTGFTIGSTSFSTSQNETAIIVQFTTSNTVVKALLPDSAAADSRFYSVGVDGSNNVIAAGSINQGDFNFGGASAPVTGSTTGENCLLVKYNSALIAQWTKTATGNSNSLFNSVFADSAGNVYAAGEIDGIGPFNFGNGIIPGGSYAGSNSVAVKYNAAGTALWAFTDFGTNNAVFYAIVETTYGQLFTAGTIDNGYFNFGNGNWLTAGAEANAVLVKYCQ